MQQHITLASVDRSQLKLLENWLRKPYVRKWYPDPESNLAWALNPPQGGEQAIIQTDGQSVGYIRWQTVSRDVLDSVGLTKVPANSVDIDILIGEEKHTSQGVGPAALSLLSARLKKQGGIPMLGLTSSCDNTKAHKAFLKAGFENTVRYSPEGFGECFLFSLYMD